MGLVKPFKFDLSELKNLKGDVIDTKMKAVIAITHTANYEQVSPACLAFAQDFYYNFDIDVNDFIEEQDKCETCKMYGVSIFSYNDGDIIYKTPSLRCCKEHRKNKLTK